MASISLTTTDYAKTKLTKTADSRPASVGTLTFITVQLQLVWVTAAQAERQLH